MKKTSFLFCPLRRKWKARDCGSEETFHTATAHSLWLYMERPSYTQILC